MKTLKFGLIPAAILGLAACGDDDNQPSPGGGAKKLRVEIENISTSRAFIKSGVFNTPVGKTDPGGIGPGEAYEFSFTAPRGASLSLATMFVPSNDLFYAPDPAGIALYDEAGSPTSGDVTAQIMLWDAGTEKNEEPGLGAHQPPAATGDPDPTDTVRPADDDFANLPRVEDVLKVTVTPGAASAFTVRIENVSTATTLATSDGETHAVPVAPGVWVVHTTDAPLFDSGAKDRGDGLEALAEMGDPSTLGARLARDTGLTSILAPGVWAVHRSGAPLFEHGMADPGEGLEALAEDGSPGALAAAVAGKSGVTASGVFNTPDGANEPGAATPGATYSFTIEARPGDRLSFATMFVQSNDLFYAPDPAGIALFDAAGAPVSDVTSRVTLWDAGTEVNQEPGIGPDQAPRQGAAPGGAAEGGTVRPVDDSFTYPAVDQVIRVTVTQQ